MSLLSNKLRSAGGGSIIYWCQGCESLHRIQVGEGPRPRWGWNGNVEAPTFTPSVLVTGRDFTEKGDADFEAWHAAGCPKPAPEFDSMDLRCHTFVTDGQVQFLTDCTHKLAGQTLLLPDLPEGLRS